MSKIPEIDMSDEIERFEKQKKAWDKDNKQIVMELTITLLVVSALVFFAWLSFPRQTIAPCECNCPNHLNN